MVISAQSFARTCSHCWFTKCGTQYIYGEQVEGSEKQEALYFVAMALILINRFLTIINSFILQFPFSKFMLFIAKYNNCELEYINQCNRTLSVEFRLKCQQMKQPN